MNVAELTQFIKSQVRENQTELDPFIELQINLSYRKYARMALWPQLRVDDESITTVASTQTYVAPYPIEQIVPDSVRYDVTSTRAGYIIPLTSGTETMLYRGSAASTLAPQSVTLGGSDASADYYNTGTVTVANRGTAVTSTGAAFASAMVGKWIVFHMTGTTSNDAVSGDYGYKIAAMPTSTTLTLAAPYRGPVVTTARYSIEPASAYRIRFDPLFTEGSKTIKYAWQRKPARLFNPEDMPEVDVLSEAIGYDVIAKLLFYHKSLDQAQMAASMARSEFIRAKSSVL